MAETKWVIPDWQKKSAYRNYPQDHMWDWEFLRRSPKYRKAWLEDQSKPNPNFNKLAPRPFTQHRTFSYTFQIRHPLKPQFATVRKLIKNLIRGKRKTTRNHQKKWQLYLRVLDAREAGVKFVVIGRELLKLEDYDRAASRAKQVHNAARRLRDKNA